MRSRSKSTTPTEQQSLERIRKALRRASDQVAKTVAELTAVLEAIPDRCSGQPDCSCGFEAALLASPGLTLEMVVLVTGAGGGMAQISSSCRERNRGVGV